MNVKQAVLARKTNLVPTQQVYYMFRKGYHSNTSILNWLGKKSVIMQASTSFGPMDPSNTIVYSTVKYCIVYSVYYKIATNKNFC